MVIDGRSKITEDILCFEKENPDLIDTINLFGITIEKYNKILLNMSANEVIVSDSSEA